MHKSFLNALKGFRLSVEDFFVSIPHLPPSAAVLLLKEVGLSDGGVF